MARTDAQSWSSGLAAVKKTEHGRKKGLRQAPRYRKRTVAPTAARAGDAVGSRGMTTRYFSELGLLLCILT
ncbi:hypothetical protein NDU88_004105 [Pleurodeles waltl]|uniref:Uncharacterized protein n=1 Tax=Pleurodeles waltl TaxID=8319 RepID=A0AAV7W7A9_PLEWA|nr:hypothetical protein NDU88_004105 [Pleurodeles waltl]